MPREGADGGSAREAAGEVVPEHWAEITVGRNGVPSVTGEGRTSAHECGNFPNPGGTTDRIVRPEPFGSGRFFVRRYR